MVRVDEDAVSVDFDNGQASLTVSGLPVFDDHDIANSLTYGLGLPGDLGFPYPAIAPVFPVRATVSFDVEWTRTISSTQIENTSQQFKGLFLQTAATIGWSSEESGFQFQSEAPNPSFNLISVLAKEQNGAFFT
jgi:hypothetical protein